MSSHPWTCEACVEVGRRGTCAPSRCYCGHATCHAFASWKPRKTPDITLRTVTDASAWDQREDSTWIDKL